MSAVITHNGRIARFSTAPAARPGLVLIADGVGTRGIDSTARSLRFLARRARLPLEVRPVHWGHGFGRWHADLCNVDNHLRRATELARLVEQQRAHHQGGRIVLIGRSGGSGIVAGALGQLAPDAVDLTIFLAPALSPGYDLGPALQAVRGELVVFWSPLDLIMLGLGTGLFGTIDRIKCASAGLVGFQPGNNPSAEYRAHARRLRQIRWRPEMARTGYVGDHWSIGLPPFLARYVLPILADCLRTDP